MGFVKDHPSAGISPVRPLRGFPVDRGVPIPRFVPLLSFLPTSAVSSAHDLAGLLHPATGLRVRVVSSRRFVSESTRLPAAPHPSKLFPRRQVFVRHRTPNPLSSLSFGCSPFEAFPETRPQGLSPSANPLRWFSVAADHRPVLPWAYSLVVPPSPRKRRELDPLPVSRSASSFRRIWFEVRPKPHSSPTGTFQGWFTSKTADESSSR